MFWLPYGWFPYYAEWLMSFPKAPMGSVSIVSWQLACNGMVTLLTELITSILGLVLKAKQGQQQQGKAKFKVPAGAANAKSESAASAQQEKKEL